ncbi:response regulator transcription factor [Bacteroides hominis]|jgi:DNA-binding CsgD family transcriptional regulator|uniref:response regulator transcription factor n=1 Tax=Bacteroides hominis TaxID=2763023 RepID=UPI002273BDC8|nr:LuxR C-terminal-related transcriptional regulator [Bacteroides fragilis]MCY2674366.1 LuxR C-terminal-related transcriptional regulator [Bacteroides fragilis]MDA1494320.1 LuxR C-terminal-related transcriptional regulator [Bacteroides fragilis]
MFYDYLCKGKSLYLSLQCLLITISLPDMDIVDKLNKEFLAQPFCKDEQLPEELKEYKQIAYNYARIENAIVVLSDMHTNISYIYYGGTAETLGIAKRGESRNFESIWEKEIFKQIHPDDLSEKYVQELRFYHFLKQIPAKKRADYFLMSKLRMRNTSGKYVPVLHRMFYVSTHSSNSMWLALCLYNLSTDPTMNCMVINSANGQAIELEKQDYSSLLSDREKVILKLIDTGKTSQEIARTLFISKNTVSRHRQNILEKLQVKNSIEACRIAKELKLLS